MKAELTAAMLAHPAVSALAGDRIQWKRRDKGGSLPAVVLHLVFAAPDETHDGQSGLSRSVVQANCLAANAAEADDLAEAVKAFAREQGNSTLRKIFVTGEGDLEPAGQTPDTEVFGTRLDLTVWHRKL